MSARYVALTGLLTLIGFVTVFGNPEAPVVPKECVGCGEKIQVVAPEDPRFTAMKADMQEKLQGMQAKWAAKAHQARVAAMLADHGTTVYPNRALGDFELQASVCEWFRTNNPEPEERAKVFQYILDQTDWSITGWNAAIRSIDKTEQGCLVEIKVRPRLAAMRGVPFTAASCIEEWFMTRDGEVTLLSARPGEEIGILMSD